MPGEDMARDMGANRTFRSIFGADGEPPADKERVDQGQDPGPDRDQTRLADDAEEDGDGMWSDADNNEDAAGAGAGAAASDAGGASSKSIADWADDEDDEDVWKDALQARVNQLELVLQAPGGDGATGGGEVAPRPAGDAREGRHKMQRTARGRASNSSSGSGGAAADQAGARKKRPGSTDFIARNIQAVELKRSVSGGSSRTDSPAAAAGTARLRRKGSAELAGALSPASGGGAKPRGPVFDLSETEAIRRFVVDDMKQMSMERLVNNAKRLHFLEEFFQHHAPATAATSSTAAAAPLSPSSCRSDA